MDRELPPWEDVGLGVSARMIPERFMYFDPSPLPEILPREEVVRTPDVTERACPQAVSLEAMHG